LVEDALDEIVRRADPDRWLATRFVADRAKREDLIALYAFDLELERARRVTTTPLMAQIRLAWWAEALDEIAAGKTPRAHPVASALADAVVRRGLAMAPLAAMIEAWTLTAGVGRFELDEARDWAEGVGGSAAEIGASILDPQAPAVAVRPAGRLIALARLSRAGLADRDLVGPTLKSGLAEANRAARDLPAVAFPAIAPATLVRMNLAGARATDLERRLRLVWAVTTGRL
jgi:phytoene synthase